MNRPKHPFDELPADEAEELFGLLCGTYRALGTQLARNASAGANLDERPSDEGGNCGVTARANRDR